MICDEVLGTEKAHDELVTCLRHVHCHAYTCTVGAVAAGNAEVVSVVFSWEHGCGITCMG